MFVVCCVGSGFCDELLLQIVVKIFVVIIYTVYIRSTSCISSYMFRPMYRAIFRLVFRMFCMYSCWCFESYEVSYYK